MHRTVAQDKAGNTIRKFPDGSYRVYNSKGKLVDVKGSQMMLKRYGYKTKTKKGRLYTMSQADRSEKFLERNLVGSGFRSPRKGLINLNSLDDLARM